MIPNYQAKIYILLATYNGAKYLKDQLDSLLVQTYKEWVLYIHDDNSSDETVNIIKEYQSHYIDKIIYIDDTITTGSAKNNFTYLLNYIDDNYDYLMFCDQDDIWLPKKIETTYLEMLKLEVMHPSLPLLVFTDLTVVDQNLNILSNSLMNYQNKDISIINSLEYMLVENLVTGCTVMINRQSKELSLPISKHAIMHDWWITLQVKNNNGIISYLESSYILYRQHENNDTGAKKFSLLKMFSKISSIYKYKKTATDLGLDISFIDIVMTKLLLVTKHIFKKTSKK